MRTLALALLLPASLLAADPVKLFNGKDLTGWEGNEKTWRVEDGAITGGSLEAVVPRNEFLCTTKTYDHFELTVQFKLLGDPAKANGGVQFRTSRIPNSSPRGSSPGPGPIRFLVARRLFCNGGIRRRCRKGGSRGSGSVGTIDVAGRRSPVPVRYRGPHQRGPGPRRNTLVTAPAIAVSIAAATSPTTAPRHGRNMTRSEGRLGTRVTSCRRPHSKRRRTCSLGRRR